MLFFWHYATITHPLFLFSSLFCVSCDKCFYLFYPPLFIHILIIFLFWICLHFRYVMFSFSASLIILSFAYFFFRIYTWSLIFLLTSPLNFSSSFNPIISSFPSSFLKKFYCVYHYFFSGQFLCRSCIVSLWISNSSQI